MIIVTGSGRSGSSMMMQTLKIWGYPIAGVPFHADFPIQNLNPKGYWDLPFNILMNGIGQQFADMGVKVFGHWLSLVSPEYVNKVIVCKRKSNTDQDTSLMKAFHEEIKVKTSSEPREEMLKTIPTMNDLGVIRRNNYREVRKFLKKNKHIEKIKIYYEDVIDNPKEELQRLADFLELTPETMDKAINNIEK